METYCMICLQLIQDFLISIITIPNPEKSLIENISQHPATSIVGYGHCNILEIERLHITI